ncbi:PaaI family thioesterase [Streptomyces sp. NPDC001858]
MTTSGTSTPALADLAAAMPFTAGLGIVFEEAAADAVTATLAWKPELCTLGDVLHGGALMSLADSAGAVCAFLNLPPGAGGTTTLESKTNLMRPVGSGSVRATARPLHVGRTVIVVQTELRDDRDRLVAQTTQTQVVLQPGPS